jgi:hypothetical protein
LIVAIILASLVFIFLLSCAIRRRTAAASTQGSEGHSSAEPVSHFGASLTVEVTNGAGKAATKTTTTLPPAMLRTDLPSPTAISLPNVQVFDVKNWNDMVANSPSSKDAMHCSKLVFPLEKNSSYSTYSPHKTEKA